MRICFIANPNSIHTRRWVNWFTKRGHQTCLIADKPIIEPWPEVSVYDLSARMNWRKLRYLAWGVWVRRIVEQWQPEILHAHQVTSAGWLGAAAGHHPFVVTPWGSDLYQHPYRSALARWLAGYVLKRADLVTADAEDLRQQAVRFGANPDCVHVIQWGVDLDVFKPNGDASGLGEQLGVKGASVVLSPRGVKAVYNLDTIIKAIPRIRAALPGTVFVLRDYSADRDYRADLQALIGELELEQGICWLGELAHWEQTADTYRLADVVISVPSSDGTPVSVLEAMACGAPVVASDLASLREWITDGENGLLVPVRDAEALAEAVIKLLRAPQLRAKFRERNLTIIQDRANHQKEMEKMEALYYSVLDRETRP